MKCLVRNLALIASLATAAHLAGAAPAVSFAEAGQSADEALATKVKSQIDSTAEFQGSAVTVAAAGGVVTLSGTTPTAVVRLKIVELTQKTDGVTRVVNKVKIAAPKK